MPNCTVSQPLFPVLKRRQIDFDFSGGCVSSFAGSLLLSKVDKKIGLTQKIAKLLPDDRDKSKVEHQAETLLKQRVYALACGEEDLIDHNDLKNDLALQTAVGVDEDLASASTMQRFDQRFDRRSLKAVHEELIQQFINSYSKAPKTIILDFDATDNRLYGEQEGRYYNHHYRGYCYLPLYVFCGDQLLAAILRPSSKHGNWLTVLVLKMLVKRLRKAWPKTQILFRGDSGFYSPKIINLCESIEIDYAVGYSPNSALHGRAITIGLHKSALEAFEESSEPQKWFGEINDYKARSWPHERRIVVKAEVSNLGTNTRYVLTSLKDKASSLYSEVYCERGDMENRIKEQKWLFSDLNSCSDWWPNQFRVILSGLAYTLLERLRVIGLKDTLGERWQVRLLREKLLKISAVVTRNTRRIKFMAASTTSNQRQSLFYTAAIRLNLSPD